MGAKHSSWRLLSGSNYTYMFLTLPRIWFRYERNDSNLRRRRKLGGNVIKAHLKKEAVPSRVPNLPKYLSNEPVAYRDDVATSTRRLELENEWLHLNIIKLEKEDFLLKTFLIWRKSFLPVVQFRES